MRGVCLISHPHPRMLYSAVQYDIDPLRGPQGLDEELDLLDELVEEQRVGGGAGVGGQHSGRIGLWAPAVGVNSHAAWCDFTCCLV